MTHARMRIGAVLVAAAALSMFSLAPTVQGQQSGESNHQAAMEHAKSLSRAFRHAAGIATPSVVKIEARTQARQMQAAPRENPFRGTPFEDFFNEFDFGREFGRSIPPSRGVGSGVIIDSQGVILTNNHVVEGADKVVVYLSDGRQYETSDFKTDPQTDIAVIRISGAGTLPEAKLGDSDELEIGDWVIAIGNPFGLDSTVSAGIISGKQRNLRASERGSFLQTDAAINPGNSGGPLVNLDGEIVGINTAIASNSGGYQGVGFAIPINEAKWVVSQLIEQGSVRRAYLGVKIGEVTAPLAEQFGVGPGEGVLVAEVMPNTPAAEAGFKEGDLITAFAGRPVRNPRELQSVVERAPLGSKQQVRVLRDGKATNLSVVVREMPSTFAAADEAVQPRTESADVKTATNDKLGLTVAEMSDDAARRLGYAGYTGVLVTDVEAYSAAHEAGLREGMLIRQIDKRDVTTVAEFEAAIDKASLADGVLLLVRTARGEQFFVVIRSS